MVDCYADQVMNKRKAPQRINTTLRLARIHRWLTTYEIAHRLGCHQSTYTAWECQATPCANAKHRQQLSSILKVPEERLFQPDFKARLFRGIVPNEFPTTVKGARRQLPPMSFDGPESRLESARSLLMLSIHDLDRGDLDLCLENLELVRSRIRKAMGA